jgi:hypothetical protein
MNGKKETEGNRQRGKEERRDGGEETDVKRKRGEK